MSCLMAVEEVNFSHALFIHSMYCMNSLNSEPFAGAENVGFFI